MTTYMLDLLKSQDSYYPQERLVNGVKYTIVELEVSRAVNIALKGSNFKTVLGLRPLFVSLAPKWLREPFAHHVLNDHELALAKPGDRVYALCRQDETWVIEQVKFFLL